ncbi:MAG TPA: molybdate ABC transporter substrate-binding protein [Thermoanaerobaculia bacterium]|nr:molybdate ABC transporter substrate-binding protein [Thermoanaerobaculia bacterium]
MRYLLPILLFALHLSAAEVRVFAAASLTDVLQNITSVYEERSGDKIVFNFGASSVLARQIEREAPADLFFSADEAKMDWLQNAGLIRDETRVSFISNVLVVVGTKIRFPKDLIGKKLALAEPSTVPAGIYAKQWLTSVGIWKQVEPNVIPTDNVRAALAAVKAGNADAAIVYRTDLKDDAPAYIAAGPVISYPVAVLKHAEQPDAARKFLAFLKSPDAKRLFQAHGFIFHAFKTR